MTENMREAFASAMVELGRIDDRLVVLVGDISHGILQPFAKEFPDRYYNIGICEPTIVNMSAGLSRVGLIPIVHTIAPFLIERSYEQIKLDFGYQKRGLNLISVGGAFDYSQLGCSHHCYTDVSLISHIEGSQVFVPGTAQEFRSLFNQTYRSSNINYFKLTEFPHSVDTSKWTVRVGEGLRVREGNDITIATTGAQLETAVNAAEVLSREEISVEIMYFPTMKPFDHMGLHQSVLKTRRLITLEELSAHDGLFNLALQSTTGIEDLRFRQLAINGFIHGYGSYHDLCAAAGLSIQDVIRSAHELMDKK
jgi:transketolase